MLFTAKAAVKTDIEKKVESRRYISFAIELC